jgi:hypothetical protein
MTPHFLGGPERRAVPHRASRVIDGVRCFECTTCFAWKPATDFYRLSRRQKTRCGIFGECKACNKSRRVKYRRELRQAQSLGLNLREFRKHRNHNIFDLDVSLGRDHAEQVPQIVRHVKGHAHHAGFRRVAGKTLAAHAENITARGHYTVDVRM